MPPSTPPSVIDTPMPSTSITNKAASQGASLYHTCRSVLDRLAAVEGMAEYLDADITPPSQLNPSNSSSTTSSVSSTASEPSTPTSSTSNDPLSKLWSICRRGDSLCILFNALHMGTPIKIAQRDTSLNQLNACKASVYHFLVSCRKYLNFPEEDVFTITDLYQGDTNGFVKVVNTINKILHLLEERGVISVRCSNRNSDPNAPKDIRGKVVMELLETERKYVQDLEILQKYMRELQNQKVLSPNTIHYLFGNLDKLVDFQRRFLIQMEDMAEKPAQEQRLGLLFVQMEEAFSVYEPYCANYYSAQDLVVQEAPKLQKLANILNPTYELPSMLIKPVQRICKYPLLMSELIKSTDKAWSHLAEMEQGREAIKRVAEKVNETQRKHENVQAVEDLKKRIDDGSSSIESYGSLMLQDKLSLMTKDSAREMCLFLFERCLLICKENKEAAKNRLTKSNTIIKKKRRGSLQERLNVGAHQIFGVHNRSLNGTWMLVIEYRKRDMESFTLLFRNEEQLKLWESALNKIKNSYTSSTGTNVPHSHHTPIHMYAMPSPSDSGASFMDDDDDEDEFYDYEFYDELPQPTRSRSNSISAQFFNSIRPGGKNEVKSRQYPHHMPGMNLSPLPRTSASTTTPSSNTIDYGMYPVSPPPSHPSSPTSSSRMYGANSPLAAKYMGSINGGGGIMLPTPPNDLPFPPVVNRTQSQSAAAGLGIGTTTTNKSHHHQQRLRSQSSPNIHKAAVAMSRAPYSHDSVTNNSSIRQIASSPRLSDHHDLKVKLSYDDKIYVIKTAEGISYTQLMEKVERKIRCGAGLGGKELLRLKYLDEDGDLITINSDDDVQMAFENRGRHPSVSLFVNA
ncbi:hypothetical protein K492DRAFT_194416 [Lichtheimia hyalospora FSU 10163]|nr:hypothetical protein K492DRAFT_194416 [Lichtheimia hyalospora FSU 10163]